MAFFQTDSALAQKLGEVLTTVRQAHSSLGETQVSATWLVYDPPVVVNTGGALSPEAFWQYQPRGASYRGVERVYPASVVKLFYLVAVHEWLEQGMMQPTAELDRAVADMIIDSGNDATGLVVDMLTGTTGGPELPSGPFESWLDQRNLVNRYFLALQWPELAAINVNQKTWCDGPYGRERAALGPLKENRNMLTTEAVARLVHSIVGGVSVSAVRSQAMMALMKRSLDPKLLAADPENQVDGFLGGGLPTETQVWSKAGLTSRVRHDVAYIEPTDRHPYLLTVFTEGPEQSKSEEILPMVSRLVFEAMADLPASQKET